MLTSTVGRTDLIELGITYQNERHGLRRELQERKESGQQAGLCEVVWSAIDHTKIQGTFLAESLSHED